ncbi:MAG: hypothetical protein PHV37_06655 [Candidatus Gastranaerophilales bacterium]|nr:hypothetical protein [Candidatus Gastranaerophilales bacterium]
MNIESLKIQKGLFHWFFNFNSIVTLINSENNSTGKTTLLRFLLYAMGFSIPSTKGLKMEEYTCYLKVTSDSNEHFDITRTQNYCSLKMIDNKIEYYSLPADKDILLSKIFGIENLNIINNILGIMYVDQEKGWTLLNRGVVIGSNHFNIHNFVQGLGNIDCSELYNNLNYLTYQLNKYKSMFDVANYQLQIQDITQSKKYDSLDDEINKKIVTLQIQKKPLVLELEELKKVLNKNKNFKNYISKMQLSVQNKDGIKIPVNAKTIIGYTDNNEYISTKVNILKTQIVKIDNKIKFLINEKKQVMPLMSVKTLIEQFDNDISKININYNAVKNMINKINIEKRNIETEIDIKTKSETEIVNMLNNIIRKYTEELGVNSSYLSPRKDYIFTSDLKSLSGAVFHKIVFAFKLAYVFCLEQYAHINIPIILDSPRGKEIDDCNIEEMIKILKRDFSNHQIIIASIYKYNFSKINFINLNNGLLELNSQYFMK